MIASYALIHPDPGPASPSPAVSTCRSSAGGIAGTTPALEDGADPHVIETRVTHTKKSRSAFDGYNRGRQWEITCTEVAKLKIARPPAGQGEVIALPLAAGHAGGTCWPSSEPVFTGSSAS